MPPIALKTGFLAFSLVAIASLCGGILWEHPEFVKELTP